MKEHPSGRWEIVLHWIGDKETPTQIIVDPDGFYTGEFFGEPVFVGKKDDWRAFTELGNWLPSDKALALVDKLNGGAEHDVESG